MVVLAALETSSSDFATSSAEGPQECPELRSAVTYWVSALLNHDKQTPLWKMQIFQDELFRGLRKRIDGHWYPDNPDRGQGYRALLCAERVDGLLQGALYKAGLAEVDFRTSDQHMVMYIDPGNVSLRITPSHAHGRRAETTHILFPPESVSSSYPPSTSPPRSTTPPGYSQFGLVRVTA
jgi:hypothetical protein